MVDNSLALQIRGPQFDFGNALAQGAQIGGLQTTNALRALQLKEHIGQQNALANYQSTGDLNSLRAHPDMMAKMVTVTAGLDEVKRKRLSDALEANAKDALELLSIPAQARQGQWLARLAKAREAGRIDDAKFTELSQTPPTDQLLTGIRNQSLTVLQQIELQIKEKDRASGSEFSRGLAALFGGTAPASGAAPIPQGGVPPRAPVQSSSRVWGDDEGVRAGLYDPPSRPGATPQPNTVPFPQQPANVAGVPARQLIPSMAAAAVHPGLPKESQALAGKLLEAALKAEAEGGGPKNVKDRAQIEEGMRKEFTTQAKSLVEVRDAFRRIESAVASPSPAGDIALIFNFMKMLDPGSTVREGEFATAQNAAGIPERIVNMYNKALKGELLNGTQRSDFVSQARRIHDTSQRQIESLSKQYRNIAKRLDIDERNVIIDVSSVGASTPAIPPPPPGFKVNP